MDSEERWRTRWRRALVTGASSGIGAAVARLLGESSTALVLVARDESRLRALAERLPTEVEILCADLADAGQLAKVEERLADEASPVDLLVNNAGFAKPGLIGEIPIDDSEAELRVNALAPLRLTHAAVAAMRRRGRGTILNVSSVLAFQPGPGRANYAATKAYLTSFTLALQEELRGSGVTATALCPGLTRTEFHARSGQDMSRVPSWLFQSAERVARAGLDAAAEGMPLCVPGWHNRLAVSFYRHAPVALVRRVGDVLLRRVR